MGTHGLVTVYYGKKPLVSIVSNYDGYPEGLGKDLARFLDGCQMVNGIPAASPKKGKERFSNGIDCLAAQLVTYLKEDADAAGGFYLTPPVTIAELQEEDSSDYVPYVYEVRLKGKSLELSVFESNYMTGEYKKKFNGSPDQFLNGKKKASTTKKSATMKTKKTKVKVN